jgi:hemerythrin superfamily protein
MGTMMKQGSDIVTFLKEQHQQVKGLLERVAEARGDERSKAFTALRRTMAVHETAEEEIIHPAAKRNLPNGASIVEARLREEREAKKALTELEAMDVDSAEFDAKFATLHAAVLAHAESEEREEFAKLAAILDASKLERMSKVAAFAESVAPTRPHPGFESQAANILIGPFAAMVDRARDAFAGKN